jgi:hypothetical protein
VLQALLEALEGRNRDRVFAAQVVQAHQSALRMFGQRVAADSSHGQPGPAIGVGPSRDG